MQQQIIYDQESEMTVLADMLDTPSIIPSVLDILETSDFYLKSHQIIFDAIKAVYEQFHTCDATMVAKVVKEQENLNRIGGLPFLFDLINYALDPQNAKYHAEIVRENGNARRVLKGLHDVENTLRTEGYSSAMTKLSKIMPKAETGRTTISIPEAMDEYYKLILEKKAKIEKGEDLDEMTTGFYDFDQQTASERGTMLVIGGDPGSGKSTLMRSIAYNRFKQGKKGLLFTTEMKREAVSACFYSMLAQVSVKGLQKASLDASGWDRVDQVHSTVDKLLGWVDDVGSPSLQHIQAIARERANDEGLDFIVIDYIQKCSVAGFANRTEALENYAYELDALGKELNLHVILISQLNRDERLRMRATGAGYKGSSGIEEAGWCVTTLKTTNIDPLQADSPDLREFITVEVTKDKTASKALFPLVFEKEYLRFRAPTVDERELWQNEWLSKL